MKKVLLILAVIAVGFAIYSFTTKDTYPDNISEELIAMYEAEYVKSITNETLNTHLQKNFVRYFDEVDYVHAQHNKEIGYYYLVFGKKNSSSTIQALKINKSDIDNETYTYIDFTNIEVNENTEYCWEGITNCPCEPDNTRKCANMVCGTWDGNECQLP